VKNGKFVAVIHPDTTFTLFGDTNIRNALLTAKQQEDSGGAGSLFTGAIGDYMGFTFVETPLAPVVLAGGEGGANVYLTVVFGMDYFGKVKIDGLNADSIFKTLGSGGTEDPLDQRWTQGWKMTHASKILNELNAVVIEHAVR
jgi:N4-gp56 family major capsid protein